MLQEIVDWLTYDIITLDSTSLLGKAINYFIYDSIKILFLLFVMIFIIGFLRSYISPEKIKKYLKGRKPGMPNVIASFFGAITPFCSCSSIPMFLSFIRAGIPLGVAFSFLITSPLVNEYLVVMMFAFFGWKVTAVYVVFGMLVGIIAGMVMGRMRLERYIVKDMVEEKEKVKKFSTIKQRAIFGFDEALDIVKKLWIWVLVGVAIGAIIHNFVPEQSIHTILDKTGFFAVPIAVIIGVPIYGSCAAILPIAAALFGKGVPLGTALAFMMAISALSLPEAIILRRAMTLKLILIFFAIVSVGLIVIGYLFNALQPFLI